MTTKSKTSFISDLMNKSTIFDRNEERRRRTLALKDDRRPPAIRVLSGLPGFRIVFPPFDPSKAIPIQAKCYAKSLNDTQFYLYSEPAVVPLGSTHSSFRLGAIGLAAASGAGLSEILLGRRHTPTSPFATAKIKYVERQVLPIFQDGAIAALAVKQNPIYSSTPSAPAISFPRIAIGACNASLLFGTKAAIQHMLNIESPLGTVLSSAAAGVVHGLFQLLTADRRFTLGREVAAVTAYFTSYESILSVLQHHQQTKSCEERSAFHSNVAVAVAGSCAGSLSVIVRGIAGASTAIHPVPLLGCHFSLLRTTLVAMRAAPTHAIFFLTYENVLRELGSSTTN